MGKQSTQVSDQLKDSVNYSEKDFQIFLQQLFKSMQKQDFFIRLKSLNKRLQETQKSAKKGI